MTSPTALCGPVPPGFAAGASPEELRAVFRGHPAGVSVIAASEAGVPFGFTATSVISVSLEPALLAFSVRTGSVAGAALSRVDSVTINFLALDQAWVSRRFATPGPDRFGAGFVEGVHWLRLPTAEPVVVGAVSWVRGRIRQRVPAGASRLVLVEAVQVHRVNDEPALVYLDRRYGRVETGDFGVHPEGEPNRYPFGRDPV